MTARLIATSPTSPEQARTLGLYEAPGIVSGRRFFLAFDPTGSKTWMSDTSAAKLLRKWEGGR